MKNQNLSNLTTAELLQKEKNSKRIFGVLIGLLCTTLFAAIYTAIKQSSIAISSTIMCLSLLAFLFAMQKGLKAIKIEIETRKKD